jgi:hypothetical protein
MDIDCNFIYKELADPANFVPPQNQYNVNLVAELNEVFLLR